MSRFSRIAPVGSLTLSRATEVVASCRMQPAVFAMQGIRYLCNAWTCARRMGRKPRGCVFGCLVEDGIRDCSVCDVLRCGVACAGGPVRPFFGVFGPGDPEWRQLAVAAEVYNSAAHRCHAEDAAAAVLREGGLQMLSGEVARLARAVVEALPVRCDRRRGYAVCV